MLRYHKFFLCFSLVCFALLLTGCVFGTSLRQKLANHGPMALDAKNPYVAANLFLSKEAEKSTVLKGFLQVRGVPEVVEVRKRFLQSYVLFLFYLKGNEAYRADEGRDGWAIKGPETIPTVVRNSLEKLRISDHAPPVVIPETAENREELAKVKELVKDSDKQQKNPFQRHQTTVKPLRTEEEVHVKPPNKEPRAADITPKEIDALEIIEEPIESSGKESNHLPTVASESASGDVVHHVSYPGETLRMIANWYTGDPVNAGRIARINDIKDMNQLSLGQTVRVPRYLLIRTQPLTKEEVEQRSKH